MAKFILAYRYLVFVLAIVCSAVICSVAVWNLTLSQAPGNSVHVDDFLICLGVLGIVFIFPTLCIDVFRTNALPSRIWFECIWTGIFWLLSLSGAAAVTATLPQMLCGSSTPVFVPVDGALPNENADVLSWQIIRDSCTATKVLLAFTWIFAIGMLSYFCGLAILVIMHHQDDPQIWQCSVRHYSWFAVRSSLNSGPTSPSSSFYSLEKSVQGSPQKQRTEFSKRMVTRPNIDVEKQDLRNVSPVPPIPAAPPPRRIQQSTRQASAPGSSLPRTVFEPSQLRDRYMVAPSGASQQPAPGPTEPTKYSPVAASPVVKTGTVSVSPATTSHTRSASSVPSQPYPKSHSKRLSNGRRPPPLNLTGITAFEQSQRANPR
ncbi:hypothetical protein OBBRIDRAFT_788770 [Obba rivulosa]|uniref:Uncharacterized protein n=1 Tax=Obba rivulosa TaxID=1052685 RepID=A0A8E2J5K0_9APHY|nr:hypothetical protein OBBRIDRAFT_788770 [Obba rivulosa]